MAETVSTLDWIEGTQSDVMMTGASLRALAASTTGTPESEWRPDKAFNRYALCMRHGSSMRALSGKPDMGTHFIVSGQAITALGKSGHDQNDIVTRLNAHNVRMSRIDLAVDCFNTGLSLRGLFNDLRHRRADTASRTHYMISSDNGGLTLYIGAPQSDKHLRAYNKAAEVKHKASIPDGTDDWIRVELVAMREQARFANDWIQRVGIDETSRTAIRGFVDFPTSGKWISAIGGTADKIGASSRKTTDTGGWLLDVVARVVAKQAIADAEFLMQFQQRVSDEMASLGDVLE